MEAAFTAVASKYPQKKFNPKDCRWCFSEFVPVGPSHHYCSDNCRKEVNADKYYRRTYGVGLRWVVDKLKEQQYTCAICKKGGFKMRDDHYTGLNLDHCHTTGNPRGLLCHNCNRALGLLQDDPAIIERALQYVNDTRADAETSPGGAGENLSPVECCP